MKLYISYELKLSYNKKENLSSIILNKNFNSYNMTGEMFQKRVTHPKTRLCLPMVKNINYLLYNCLITFFFHSGCIGFFPASGS